MKSPTPFSSQDAELRRDDAHVRRLGPGGQSRDGGPVAVFIDAFAFRGAYGGGFAHAGGWAARRRSAAPTVVALPMSGAGAAGYWHAPVYHGAWYGHPGYGVGAFAAGAAVGAAVAQPYYPPPACGYYPYPPCY